jgi:hypothetical protein
MDGEKSVVKLVGTEHWGVQEQSQHWTTVTYTAKEPEPAAHDSVCEALDDMQDELTENICQLTDLLARLRALKVAALDGDEVAIGEAADILEQRSFIDEDHIWSMGGDVEVLEELVEARTEERGDVKVATEAIETTVRKIALPYIEAGEYVQVRTRSVEKGYATKGAIIRVARYGHHVNITVFPEVVYRLPVEVTPPLPGSTLESVYQKLVEAKGEAAKAILQAVQTVAPGDVERQVKLLWQAVAA